MYLIKQRKELQAFRKQFQRDKVARSFKTTAHGSLRFPLFLLCPPFGGSEKKILITSVKQKFRAKLPYCAFKVGELFKKPEVKFPSFLSCGEGENLLENLFFPCHLLLSLTSICLPVKVTNYLR